jgi:four helix bundle protein
MFVAYETSLQLIREMRGVLPKVRMHDGELARQLRDATTSVSMNLGEGRRRVGKDRIHFFRIADGSAGEVEAGIDSAIAWGYIDEACEARVVLTRLLRLLWGLTH